MTRTLSGRTRFRAGGPRNLQLILQVQLYGKPVDARPGYVTSRWADAITQDLSQLQTLSWADITVNAVLPGNIVAEEEPPPPAGAPPSASKTH